MPEEVDHELFDIFLRAALDAQSRSQRSARARGAPAALREEGILVLGSGFMTRSFAVFRRPALAAQTEAFDEWAVDALARADVDVDALTDYRSQGTRCRGRPPNGRSLRPTAAHRRRCL